MLDIVLKTKALAEINLFHSYFADNKTNHLSLIPDIKTIQFLSAYKLIAKSTSSGIAVFADINNCYSFQKLLETNEEMVWNFYLKISNKAVFQITNGLKSNNKQMLLYTHSGNNVKAEFIFDEKHYQEIHKDFKDLSSDTLGIIQIPITKKIKKHFVQIISGKSVDGAAGIDIRFLSPKTRWKYFLIPTNGNGPENPEIRSTRGNIKFKKAKKIDYKGKNAFLLETAESIELKEFSEVKLEVWDIISKSGRNFEKLIKRNLPVPRQISYLSPENSSYISEIYINI